jgi:hypothetical protein
MRMDTVLGESAFDIVEQQNEWNIEHEPLVEPRASRDKGRCAMKQEGMGIHRKARALQEVKDELRKRLRESPNLSERWLMKIRNEREMCSPLRQSWRGRSLGAPYERTLYGTAAFDGRRCRGGGSSDSAGDDGQPSDVADCFAAEPLEAPTHEFLRAGGFCVNAGCVARRTGFTALNTRVL